MVRKVKELCDWVEVIGYSSNAWIAGDWNIPLHLLSKLLSNELNQRKSTEEIDGGEGDTTNDITFKISFDSLLELAEDTLGIPVLILEKDLCFRNPNVFLALFSYVICVRNTISCDAKTIRNACPPRLVFEARNANEVELPKCPECHEHVYLIDRVVIERVAWHRQCFKCTECGQLLARGSFKKTKIGVECITHAVRRMLDKTESTSDSGRVGGRSPRPCVAPPPRPKPLPPPKPKYICAQRANPIYETLDDIMQHPSVPTQTMAGDDNRNANHHSESSVDSTSSSLEPKAETSEHPIAEDAASTDYDAIGDISSPHVRPPVSQTEEPSSTVTSPPPEDSSHPTASPSPSSPLLDSNQNSSEDNGNDNSSCDSGVVLRMVKRFNEDLTTTGDDKSVKLEDKRISHPAQSSPIAPPRPKRTSMLVSSGQSSPKPISVTTSTPSSRTSTLSRPSPAPRAQKKKLEVDDYPDYLSPFGEDEEKDEIEDSDYDESKNPFADESDGEEPKLPPVPAPRSLPPSSLPGTSDRPKIQPPPPPPGSVVEPSTPPPKPARGLPASGESRIHTLRISRKKKRAPLPPAPFKRKINFTEHVLEDPLTLRSKITSLEEQMKKVEIEGRGVEKEMLFQIGTNPHSWTKNHRTDEWIEILSKKLELIKEHLALTALWREAYLNDVHSETEYAIRCLLEKEQSEKTDWEIEREATLTSLLIFIIDEKLKLDEYIADMSADVSKGRDEHDNTKIKKMKLKKRVSLLTKRLRSSKKKEAK